MNKIVIVSGGVAIAMIAGFGYWQWTKSPTYSLKHLADAVRDHDRDAAETYLDIESVTSGLVDQLVSQSSQSTPENQWAALGQGMARGFLELMKPRIATMAKEKFLDYVETGNIKGDSKEAGPMTAVNSIMRFATMPGHVVNGISSVKKEGKLANVILNVTLNNGVEIYPELKMRDKGDHWQIVGLVNFNEILEANSPENRPVAPGVKVTIPSIEKWVESVKSEKDLRLRDFQKIYKKGKEVDFIKKTGVRWSEKCKSKPDYNCRLASYVMEMEGTPEVGIASLQRACSLGADMQSCHYLLNANWTSGEVKAEAAKVISDKCANQMATACLIGGHQAYKRGDKDRANLLFDQGCKGGEIEACYMLGLSKNLSNQKDEAVVLIKRSCEAGYLNACHQLGVIRQDENDLISAKTIFEKGCEAGNAECCLRLGVMETTVSGKMTDGYSTWAKACNGLNGLGCYFIGTVLYENGGDKEQAKAMFAQGCRLGAEESCAKIGMAKPAWL